MEAQTQQNSTVAPDTLDSLAMEIREWQRQTFPHATQLSRAKHLLKEAKELVLCPGDSKEMADIFFLLIGMTGDMDFPAVIRAKLEENKKRQWGKPDADGVVEHVREPIAANEGWTPPDLEGVLRRAGWEG